MSVNLNDYFNLGLESTNQPIENAGMINVFRTPVDSSSTNLNRVSFKFPKTGLLTGDSMITLQFVLSDSAAATSNLTPNLVNGAIGAIKRTRILVDNKVLVDLERPSLPEVVKMYSRNTQVELSEKEYKLMGNQFKTQTNSDGTEGFNTAETRLIQDQSTGAVSFTKNKILQEATSKVYGIPLKHLGADFLEQSSLPVFLLGSREIILELEFYSDCREYAVDPSGGAITSDACKVNLANCELVSTHISLPAEVEAQQIESMKKSPVTYPLKDTYLIKGYTNTAVVGDDKVETYRINFQNREVHNLLMVAVDNVPASKRITANQFANSMGDEKLQLKINGLNLFDRPIEKQPLMYQLTTYSEDGRTMKVPYNAYQVTNKSRLATKQSTDPLYLDYRGGFHYTKVDFSNANQGIFGSGTMMKTAAEIDYTHTPSSNASPNQEEVKDMYFYATISKLLTIGANMVNISY